MSPDVGVPREKAATPSVARPLAAANFQACPGIAVAERDRIGGQGSAEDQEPCSHRGPGRRVHPRELADRVTDGGVVLCSGAEDRPVADEDAWSDDAGRREQAFANGHTVIVPGAVLPGPVAPVEVAWRDG